MNVILWLFSPRNIEYHFCILILKFCLLTELIYFCTCQKETSIDTSDERTYETVTRRINAFK